MKIFDCFMYFDEEQVLDLRLNVLNHNVDYFVKCNYSNISNYCIVLNNSNKNINDNFLTKFDYNFFNILTFIFFSLFSLFGLLFYLGKNHQNNIINFINYYSNNVENLDYDIFLFEYFEEFKQDLSKKTLNYYTKGVSKS